jgi:hypothetical protein
MRRLAAVLVLLLPLVAAQDAETVRREFAAPPDDARILMRWWWFGPSATHAELERELRAMKQGGIGGVEVQAVYPLALDDPATGFHNYRHLSDEFLDALRFTRQVTAQLGMRMDVTLGSGWPFGGPTIRVTEASGELKVVRTAIPAGAASVAVPGTGAGESLIAAFVAEGDAKAFRKPVEVPLEVRGGRIAIESGTGQRVMLFFVASRTGQQVKRAAYGAEGFVFDHYSRAATERYLATTGARFAEAFGPKPPYAVFSDSLEVNGADWTPDLLAEFQKRRGYDLRPHLPALVADVGPETAAIRHDWGETLTELVDENYLKPVRAWAAAHGVKFRSQTYGYPPVSLSSNALVDLPEGEGPRWREFCETRWASSASHLYGRQVTSSETWTWLHSPAWRATPLDMKAEADRHFLQGVNQLAGHGWPYSPKEAGEPGWAFYAAAAFSDHNPWWIVMPELTKYFQRVSYLLRQGEPVNDIALYLPTDDAWARFKAGPVSLNRTIAKLLGPDVIPTILDAGYNFDFIDDKAIARTSLPYKAIVLPHIERMPVATRERLEDYAKRGGKLIATVRAPAVAPGFVDEPRKTAEVSALSQRLFGGRVAADERGALRAALRAAVAPDVTFDPPAPEIGVVHRRLADGDVYFLANTGNEAREERISFRAHEGDAASWDVFTGTATGLDVSRPVSFAPYESRVIVFSRAGAMDRGKHGRGAARRMEVSGDWRVAFPGLHVEEKMTLLRSWTEEEATRYFSGVAVYSKTVDVPAGFLDGARDVYLDFGEGRAIAPPAPAPANGMRALYEGPVREAAVVWLNGHRIGGVWRPPYRLEVSPGLHAGTNEIRIEVANTAINEMAGRALPDYRLLYSLYGRRFEPQDWNRIAPVSSGLVGPVTLVAK